VAGRNQGCEVSHGLEAIVRNEFPLARSLGTSEGWSWREQTAGDPSARSTGVGGLDSPGRAGEADPPLFASSHAFATLARDKADAWPPGEPRIRALVVMPHSPPSGKGARRMTGAPVPNPQITRETRVTLQRLASGVSKANEDRALWFLALLSKALYDKLMPMNSDPSLLRAALVGYENQLQKIDQAISDLRQRLHLAPASASQPASGRLRTLSAGARRRIAAAQKKRWAAYRKSKGAGK